MSGSLHLRLLINTGVSTLASAQRECVCAHVAWQSAIVDPQSSRKRGSRLCSHIPSKRELSATRSVLADLDLFPELHDIFPVVILHANLSSAQRRDTGQSAHYHPIPVRTLLCPHVPFLPSGPWPWVTQENRFCEICFIPRADLSKIFHWKVNLKTISENKLCSG